MYGNLSSFRDYYASHLSLFTYIEDFTDCKHHTHRYTQSPEMKKTLHITNGDRLGDLLKKENLPGEILVWRDILYDGPRNPGWPDEDTLQARAAFLAATTGGGLDSEHILETLRNQYRTLKEATNCNRIVLWFDTCLFDQSMLAHILTCLHLKEISNVELICVDAFPEDGLHQLHADRRHPVTEEQFQCAELADQAFATQDHVLLAELSEQTHAPLPWIPAAAKRWLQEQPDPVTGLGRLETLALMAIREGNESPNKIFKAVATADTSPQYWGDTTLWSKINALADRTPPLVQIHGPSTHLPQCEYSLADFRITAYDEKDIA
jgi:hypothetical protein